MSDSIQKRIVDALMVRLAGDVDNTPPAGISATSVTKNRTTRIGHDDLPTYSVYFIKQSPPEGVGQRYAPVVMNRALMVEVRAVVPGDDDDLDLHMQWITKRMSTAGRLIVDGLAQGLMKGIVEAESFAVPLEGSEGKVLEWTSRWLVEFTTLPADITQTGRN